MQPSLSPGRNVEPTCLVSSPLTAQRNEIWVSSRTVLPSRQNFHLNTPRREPSLSLNSPRKESPRPRKTPTSSEGTEWLKSSSRKSHQNLDDLESFETSPKSPGRLICEINLPVSRTHFLWLTSTNRQSSIFATDSVENLAINQETHEKERTAGTSHPVGWNTASRIGVTAYNRLPVIQGSGFSLRLQKPAGLRANDVYPTPSEAVNSSRTNPGLQRAVRGVGVVGCRPCVSRCRQSSPRYAAFV